MTGRQALSLLSSRVTEALFPTIKRQGREADHSAHVVQILRMRVDISSIPPYAFTASLVMKHGDNFTLLPFI
jgi:hypothetical protein